MLEYGTKIHDVEYFICYIYDISRNHIYNRKMLNKTTTKHHGNLDLDLNRCK
jgi:hypothetical protein